MPGFPVEPTAELYEPRAGFSPSMDLLVFCKGF